MHTLIPPACLPPSGDRIAIGSSSVFGLDAEERMVKQVTFNAASGTTTLSLDRRLQHTHLGVLMTVPGDERGHKLDMRAEVRAEYS
jgi:hypothetical protein